MATVERSTGSTEGDQQERALSPSEEDSPLVLNDTSAPLNFSELTPCQFGISVQSFTPTSLSNNKGERTASSLLLNCSAFTVFHRQKCLPHIYRTVFSHHWKRPWEMCVVYILQCLLLSVILRFKPPRKKCEHIKPHYSHKLTKAITDALFSTAHA